MNVIRCFTQRNALLIKMKVSNRRKRYDVLRNTASAEMEGIMDQTTRLILAAVVGMILLLVLIIKFKIHAMLSILIGAITIGLIAGMPFSQIVTAVNDGIGNTLKGIALLVGLGSMFGAILETSGGAQTLAVTMVNRFGDKKAAWALGDYSDSTGIFAGKKNKTFHTLLCYSVIGRTCRRTCIYSTDTGTCTGCNDVGR